MAGRKKDPAATEATRRKILETGFALFSQRNIESVSMIEIAKACGVATMTVYRYFSTKPELVVAVATWKWGRQLEANRLDRFALEFESMTAAEVFGFFLDSFLNLYQNDRDLLRFNQFFNVYIRAENVEAETLSPYRQMIEGLARQFHIIYEKAERDHTVRTDVPEEEMFRTPLHLMLAAVTRYAVGLVYQPDGDADAFEELKTLKRALLREYTTEFGERRAEITDE